MTDSKIKLTYFDLNGRAEIIRLVLTWLGKEFEDVRIPRDKWPEIKPTSPFGQVPFIEIDGKVYGQSVAIANYFAREFGLYGKTNLDGLRIDQYAGLTEDFTLEAAKAFRESDPEKKAEIAKKVKEEVAPRYLGFAEKLIQDNNGEYFAGDSISLADLIAYDVATGFLKAYVEDVLDQYPSFKQVVDKVGSNERIRAYAERH